MEILTNLTPPVPVVENTIKSVESVAEKPATTIVKVIRSFAFIGATFVLFILGALTLWGMQSSFGEGGLGNLITPLLSIIPLIGTVPFVIKSYYSLLVNYKVSPFSFSVFHFTIPVTIIAYVSILWLLLVIYNAEADYSLILPVVVLWISGTILVALTCYGIFPTLGIKKVLIVSSVLAASVTLLPLIRIIYLYNVSQTVVSVQYGEYFNPTRLKHYDFPDFVLTPYLESDSYTLFEKETHTERYLYTLCAHNNKLLVNCNYPEGGTYDSEKIGPLTNGKTYRALPYGEEVYIIEEKELP